MTLPSSNGKTAVIFGGSGFVGRYIVRELAKRGWIVVVAARHPDKALFLKTHGVVGQITPVLANIRDDASVEKVVAKADLVVNCVGILAEGGKQTFAALQAEGAARVARCAKAAGASDLIQISAIGADPDGPAQYSRTKAEGERLVREAFPDAIILRPSIVFGPEDGFFNLFAGMAKMSPVLPLIGGGHTRFQPVYVGDVADAAMAALDRPKQARGQIYELGGPTVYSFRELMEMTLRFAGLRRPLVTLPWPVATAQAMVLERLPKPLLTRDQVKNLRIDNIVTGEHPTLADLDLQPTAAEVILPTYLDKYRPGGRFARRSQAAATADERPR